MAKSNSEFKSIQKKLVAAVAMVLVASIMVVSSSYAWFTLSTAPEVTGIQTSVGSNGNLEMALREVANLSEITSGVAQQFPAANNFWGNLVDLSDSSYHMDAIALAPARLNATLDPSSKSELVDRVAYAKTNNAYVTGGTFNGEVIEGKVKVSAEANNDDPGTTTVETDLYKYEFKTKSITKPVYMLNGSGNDIAYLQTPKYGADGRVSGVTVDGVINGKFNENANGFAASSDRTYGVRAIGTSSKMSPEELALRAAKQVVSTAISDSKTAAINSLREDSVKLASIIIDYNLDNTTKYDDADVANVQAAIDNLQTIATNLDNALTQAIIAVGVAQGIEVSTINITATAIEAKSADTTPKVVSWVGLEAMQATICAADAAVTSMTGKLTTAEGDLAGLSGSNISFDDIAEPMTALLSKDDIKIVDPATGTSYDVTTLMSMAKDPTKALTVGKILMATPTISIINGLYADIAKNTDNFSGATSLTVTGKFGPIEMNGETVDVVMATSVPEQTISYTVGDPATEASVTGFYLPLVLNQLSAIKIEGVTDQNRATVITDIYGYAVDMAFRTNAKGSSLLLQTAPTNRVSDESGDITQGGGSYMQFAAGHVDFELYQVVNLMKTIRVVFMNDAGNIFGVATLDVNATRLTQTVKDESGKDVVQNVKFVAGTEGHDFADANGDAWTLNAGELVVIDGKQYIKANLQMTGFTVSADGVMTIGQKLDSPVITALQQNVPTAVTTLVYMDGDKVQNGDVAISGKSMVGTMNLQFASDAELDPMDYTYNNGQVTKPTEASIAAGKLTITAAADAGDKAATSYEVYYEGKLIGSVKADASGNATLDLNAYLDRLPDDTYKFEIVGIRDNLQKSEAYEVNYTKTTPAPAPNP